MQSGLDDRLTDHQSDAQIICIPADPILTESTDSGGSVGGSGQDNSIADTAKAFNDISQDNAGACNREGASKKIGVISGGLDGSKGSGDLAWASMSSGGKSGKSSAERKKKASWYNVCVLFKLLFGLFRLI